jgi:hypothetical protein
LLWCIVIFFFSFFFFLSRRCSQATAPWVPWWLTCRGLCSLRSCGTTRLETCAAPLEARLTALRAVQCLGGSSEAR